MLDSTESHKPSYPGSDLGQLFAFAQIAGDPDFPMACPDGVWPSARYTLLLNESVPLQTIAVPVDSLCLSVRYCSGG